MRIKSENKKARDIGMLLVYNKSDNPLNKFLEHNKLNFTVNSLKTVDSYVNMIRKNKDQLGEKDIKKVILRCGIYLGEVIRRVAPKRYYWISYEAASNLDRSISKLERSLLTHLTIYDINKKRIWFPLNRVYKYLEEGKANDLWSFAKVCLEHKKRSKV